MLNGRHGAELSSFRCRDNISTTSFGIKWGMLNIDPSERNEWIVLLPNKIIHQIIIIMIIYHWQHTNNVPASQIESMSYE